MGRLARIVGWRGRWFMRTMRARQTRPRRQASIAAGRGATADTPGLGSSRGRRGRERSGCGGSRSAVTAPTAPPFAPAPAHPALPSSIGSRAPNAPPSSACKPAAATIRGASHTSPAPGGPARSPFFAAISFITSISRSRSANSFFGRAFSCSNCFGRRTSSGCSTPNRFLQVSTAR
jgi:hypothetical protein